MSDFFTTQSSLPPEPSLFVRIGLLGLLPLLLWLTIRYRDKVAYQRVFQGLQLVQLVCLYSWYLSDGFPLEESLPLYHCRIAMFAVLFLPKASPIKDYLAYLGIGGAIVAFVYPVFDPFPIWHVTTASFVLGHYALFVNGWLYLLGKQKEEHLNIRTILSYSLVLNLFLLLVNQLTGGNYGFLAVTPLVNSHNIWFNLVLVTLANLALVAFVQKGQKRLLELS
ncbi:YwaF family protein [Streptococcus entericus]|uniref:YwaF family protein n=1 Tax=Streptococcus entericus TaxID=155680 RepID=UPI000369C18C|nr:TIGR02206 family membrane protein [Streptococcus entericus]